MSRQGLHAEVSRPSASSYGKASVLALNPLTDYMNSIHIKESNRLS